MKNPHIEECILSSRPKTTGTDVAPGIVLCVSTPGLKGFSTERLKNWFNTSVVTNLRQEVGRDITNLVVLCSDSLPCGMSWRGQWRTLSHSSTFGVVQILANHSGGRGRP